MKDRLYYFEAWVRNQHGKTEDSFEKSAYQMMRAKIKEFENKLMEEEINELKK